MNFQESLKTDDQAYCKAILPQVSRTFALSIEALPEPLRRAIRTAYLLCRVVDTVEDEPDLGEAERLDLFERFRGLLRDDAADPSAFEAAWRRYPGASPDVELARHAGAALREFRALDPALRDASRPHVLEMADGMEATFRRWGGLDQLTALDDLDDLRRYCYFVAGTVGNLLTDTFVAVEGERLPADVVDGLRARAVDFGLGLQMTNIVKDVRADRARGWCYLPASICARHGLTPEQLTDPAHRDAAMGVVRDVADAATAHLGRALEYTLLLPRDAGDVRLFVLVPMALALATLTLVRRSPAVLDGGEVKVSRRTVAEVLAEAQRVVADDDGIRELCRRADALEIGA